MATPHSWLYPGPLRSQMSSTTPADMPWADKFELANCLIELGEAGWDR